MNLRLVGTEPLVGVALQHQSHRVNPISDVHCEICDGCGEPTLARNIYFDGKRFLCAGCRREQPLADKYPK